MEFDEEEVSTTTSALPGSPVRQFSVFLENRVGALLSLIRLINEQNIEVLGLSEHDSVNVTIIRIIVTDPERTETLFMDRGIPFIMTDVCVVELKQGASSLASCLSCLLEGETNLHFSYPLFNQPNGRTALAMALEDADFARAVLLKAGFKVLYQEDISR